MRPENFWKTDIIIAIDKCVVRHAEEQKCFLVAVVLNVGLSVL